MRDPSSPYPEPGQPRFGAINGIGLWTFYAKEVNRFLQVWVQTIASPMASTTLFLIVFAVAFGDLRPSVDGVPFLAFIVPGLIMMGVLQNSFAGTASAILIAKIQNNLYDILAPPLSAGEILVGYVGAGVTRGLMVATLSWIAAAVFVPEWPANIPLALLAVVLAGAAMALVGIIVGMWATKFDHLATATNFVILPLAFLSGTFYSVRTLPEPLATISEWNPFFHFINLLRYAAVEHADAAPWVSLGAATATLVVLWVGTWLLWRRGWRITS